MGSYWPKTWWPKLELGHQLEINANQWRLQQEMNPAGWERWCNLYHRHQHMSIQWRHVDTWPVPQIGEPRPIDSDATLYRREHQHPCWKLHYSTLCQTHKWVHKDSEFIFVQVIVKYISNGPLQHQKLQQFVNEIVVFWLFKAPACISYRQLISLLWLQPDFI